MSDDDKQPPPKAGEYSAFKELLDKIANVPKAEVDEKERQFQERPAIRKKRRA